MTRSQHSSSFQRSTVGLSSGLCADLNSHALTMANHACIVIQNHKTKACKEILDCCLGFQHCGNSCGTGPHMDFMVRCPHTFDHIMYVFKFYYYFMIIIIIIIKCFIVPIKI